MLWDIDHTLIETRGVGRAIYERAFPAATGRPLTNLATIAGRTELDIMHETLRLNGIEPTDVAVRALVDALIQGYEDARDELASTGRALPGAHHALQALDADPLVHQAVLSGNLRAVSRIKLEVFDLDQYLDFASSAYGDDHEDRVALVSLAQRRAAERTGVHFDNDHTVLIGDTPNDVRTGLAAGVQVIGVATGKSSVNELINAGATITVTHLCEVRTHVA
ncbi:MAG: HAD hydrolase-like protein [Pseudonocardiaceae bacterium]